MKFQDLKVDDSFVFVLHPSWNSCLGACVKRPGQEFRTPAGERRVFPVPTAQVQRLAPFGGVARK